MIKKLAISLISIILLSSTSHSLMTKAKVSFLGDDLYELAKQNNNKVGICFIDIKTGLKLSVNGKKKFAAASVAKVPVMATVYHLMESGKISISEKIKFREQDKIGGSGVLQWMRGNTEYTIRNLMRLMIVLSDNTATRLVIDRIGTSEINSYLTNIGLTNTVIVDDTCLNEPPNPKMNYTSADDLADLLYMIRASNSFMDVSKKDMITFMKAQRYRWGIWRGVPRGVIVADKTGNIEGVLNDAGIVYSKHGDYILSIFTQGFKKPKEARKLINKVSELVYNSTLR